MNDNVNSQSKGNHLMEGLESQVSQLKQITDLLFGKLIGIGPNNGPGLLSEVQDIRNGQQSLFQNLERLEKTVAQLATRIDYAKVPHDTQEIRRITKEEIRNHLERQHEKEYTMPGSWSEFRSKFLLPMLLQALITIGGIVLWSAITQAH